MYAWSAQGSGAPVAAGDRPRRRSPTQQMRGAAADEERGSAKARGQPSGGAAPQEERRGGLLGMLGRMLGGGGGGGGDGGNGGVADSGASERQGAWASADANGGDRDDSGLRMYGAAVLALRGNAYFDPITSQVGVKWLCDVCCVSIGGVWSVRVCARGQAERVRAHVTRNLATSPSLPPSSSLPSPPPPLRTPRTRNNKPTNQPTN